MTTQIFQRVLLLATFLIGNVTAAQLQIPDVCQGSVCLTKLVWKKGFVAHTLSGTITTQKPIESISLSLVFGDTRRSGATLPTYATSVPPRISSSKSTIVVLAASSGSNPTSR
jgi:hypothetical protein